ncbi:MAG: hypothetical protein Q9M25_07755 [Mariprofundaceae bacterium]|nr:hypothetical protein [Mariprofundaceae bacterium]
MYLNELIGNDRTEMLKWVRERNLHVPLSELAFMLDMDSDDIYLDETSEEQHLYARICD